MLRYIVLDPDALSPREMMERGSQANALYLLKTLRHSSLFLLLDSRGVLRQALAQHARMLEGDCASVRAELVELLKSGRLVECAAHTGSAAAGRVPWEVAVELAETCAADAMITVGERCSSAACACTVSIDLYGESEFNPVNLSGEWSQRLDTLDEEPRTDVWRRSLAFAKWLRIYDPYFGRAEDPRSFIDGLGHLIEQWTACVHERPRVPKVSVYTSVRFPRREGESRRDADRRTRDNGEAAFERSREATAVLERLGISLDVRYKDLPRDRFHRRLLRTNLATFSIERGFDMRNLSEEWKVNWLEYVNSTSEYVAEVERGPELYERSPGNWLIKQSLG